MSSSILESSGSALVALYGGFPPFAHPMLQEDLIGPGSLLGGQFAPATHPQVDFAAEGRAFTLPQCATAVASFARPLLPEARILWTSLDSCSCSAGLQCSPELAVPSTTFLAGETTSTFDVAWECVRLGILAPWGGVLCSRQSSGRGQMRRAWHSPAGNLYISFLLPKSPVFTQDAASVAVGYTLARSLRDMGYEVLLKWPNDIIIPGQGKVGGLLLEERDGQILVGFGLNIQEAPAPGQQRTVHSMPGAILSAAMAPQAQACLLTSAPASSPVAAASFIPSPFCLWQRLVGRAKVVYENELAGKAFAEIMHRADSILAFKGRKVRFVDDDSTEALCLGLGPEGGLMLQFPGKLPEQIFSGSVFSAE